MAIEFNPEKWADAIEDSNTSSIKQVPEGIYLCALRKWEIGPGRVPEIHQRSSMQWQIIEDDSEFFNSNLWVDHNLEAEYENFDSQMMHKIFASTVRKLGFNLVEFGENAETLMPEAVGTTALIEVVASKNVDKDGNPYLNARLKSVEEHAYTDVTLPFTKGEADPAILTLAEETPRDNLELGTRITTTKYTSSWRRECCFRTRSFHFKICSSIVF